MYSLFLYHGATVVSMLGSSELLLAHGHSYGLHPKSEGDYVAFLTSCITLYLILVLYRRSMDCNIALSRFSFYVVVLLPLGKLP